MHTAHNDEQIQLHISRKIKPVKIFWADDYEATAREERAVQISLASENGRIMTALILNNGSYTPDAGMKLISCGQLDSKGISTVIENSVFKLLER